MQRILVRKLSQHIMLWSWLVLTLAACTDSASNSKPPQLPDSPLGPLNPTTKPDPGPVGPTPQPSPTPKPSLDPGTFTEIPQVGDAAHIEFAAWNIENFPKSERTAEIAGEVLKRVNVDLIGVEEIANEIAFQQLVDTMPGYKGLLSPHEYGQGKNQKVGFLYRETDLELLGWELLFERQNYAFPRPPLEAHFRIKTGEKAGLEIYAIVLHLKATSEGDSQARREKANQDLEAYVKDRQSRSPEVRVLLMGDFNERVTYAAGLNVFSPWMDQPENYTFQTKEPALAGEYTFLSNARQMIDHMISTKNVELDTVLVPKLENMVPSYRDLVSDHLPVIARMK